MDCEDVITIVRDKFLELMDNLYPVFMFDSDQTEFFILKDNNDNYLVWYWDDLDNIEIHVYPDKETLLMHEGERIDYYRKEFPELIIADSL